MSNVEYLFDNNGSWIAFKVGKYLFNANSKWIGWFPWEGIAVDVDGRYLGTVFNRDRLLVDLGQHALPYPGYPGYPSYPGYPGYPGYRGYCGYISNTKDVEPAKLKGK